MHGNLGMAKTGRKRAAVVRTASGRASEAGREREVPPAQVRRLRDAALSGLRDPEWGTELGRLYLSDQITDAMYAAGKQWAEWAAKYRNAIGVFPIRCSSGELRGNSHPVDPESERGQEIAKREAKHAEDFFKADAVLMQADRGVSTAVRRLCEDNETPGGFAELARVRTGLMHLVSHWNLTGTEKRDSRRNAR